MAIVIGALVLIFVYVYAIAYNINKAYCKSVNRKLLEAGLKRKYYLTTKGNWYRCADYFERKYGKRPTW